jgi:hypothetical protein
MEDKNIGQIIALIILVISNFVLRSVMVYYYYYWFLFKTIQIEINVQTVCLIFLILDLFYISTDKENKDNSKPVHKNIAKLFVLGGIFLVFYIIYLI